MEKSKQVVYVTNWHGFLKGPQFQSCERYAWTQLPSSCHVKKKWNKKCLWNWVLLFLIFIEIKIFVGWKTLMIIWQLEINQTVKYTKQTIQVKVMTIPNVRMHEYFCVLNTFTQMLIKFLQKTSCEPFESIRHLSRNSK